MDSKIISVIIPCYELETRYDINKTLDSIIGNSDFNGYVKDLVAVVNGDDYLKISATKRVIKEKCEDNASGLITVIESEKGVSNARNAGAKIARGDILFFCDCDVIVPDGIFRAVYESAVSYEDSETKLKNIVGIPDIYFRKEHTTMFVYAILNHNKFWKNFYNRFFPFHNREFDSVRKRFNKSIYKLNIKIENMQDKIRRLLFGSSGEHSYYGLPLYLPKKFAGTGVIFCSKNIFELVGGFSTELECFEDRVFLEDALEKGAEFIFLPSKVKTSDRRYKSNSLKKMLEWYPKYYNYFMGRKASYNHSLELDKKFDRRSE